MLLFSRFVLTALLSWLLACSKNASDARTDQGTIGTYCDQLLPTFCDYAVNTCGLSRTVSECLSDARSPCCQGTCGRAAQLVAPDVLERCKSAYTGQSSGGGGGAGGTSSGASSGASSQSAASLSCADMRAGLAPAPCREILQLLATPVPEPVPEGINGIE